jgi:dephospho-CoA kinase
MLIIGIAGGVASGKSVVARRFVELGAELLDADRCAHEVLREEAVEQQVRERWGARVFDQHGRIDRKSVARIVFAATPEARAELEFLEKLTHPRIEARLSEQIAGMRQRGVAVAVLDAAVMFKAGWHRLCDKLVFVSAPDRLRRQRALARGWTDEDLAAREARQQSLDAKRRHADTVIDNSASLESTYAQVDAIWRCWT